MPRCAQILLAALTLLLHQTIGAAATVDFAFAVATWTATTPAALIAIASLCLYHLTAYHAPRPARARH